LKQKTVAGVAAAFQSIFNGGRTPKKLWVDKGREFYNKRRKVVVRVKVLFFVFYRKQGVVLCC